MLTVEPSPALASLSGDQAWTVELTEDADVVMRVVMLLRRRRCQVLSLHYHLGDRHRPTQLRIAVRSRGGRPDAVEAWLRGVVGVLEVRRDG